MKNLIKNLCLFTLLAFGTISAIHANTMHKAPTAIKKEVHKKNMKDMSVKKAKAVKHHNKAVKAKHHTEVKATKKK